MNACMSSPSLASWPSTEVVLSHSSPARSDTAAVPADLTPGGAAQAIEQVVVEVIGALVVVAAQRRREAEHHEVIELHAGVGGLQVLQAAHEQPGAEQQQEAQRHLRGDEPLAQEQRAARCRPRRRRCP